MIGRFHKLRPHARDVRHGGCRGDDVVFENTLERVKRDRQAAEIVCVDERDGPRQPFSLGVRTFAGPMVMPQCA